MRPVRGGYWYGQKNDPNECEAPRFVSPVDGHVESVAQSDLRGDNTNHKAKNCDNCSDEYEVNALEKLAK